MITPFLDRHDAGMRLAAELEEYAHRPDVLVLALPRGGVPVGYEVARALGVPLDVLVVRKLGVPQHEELAMGAVASGGVRVLQDDLIRELRIPASTVDLVTAAETWELERRERAYRGARPMRDVRGKTVILVDDGLATGSTMRAAVAALRLQHPKRIIVAVPVAARAACEAMHDVADECVCVRAAEPFYAVGLWYRDFTPTLDAEVRALLTAAAAAPATTSSPT
jgi:putative phosphoribosyl transferase